MKVDKKQRFINLGWCILELKFVYYRQQQHPDWNFLSVEDSIYDKIEDEYKKLAAELGLPPSASDMVDFNEHRPSCIMVRDKLTQPKSDKTLSYLEKLRNKC